jgi:hypothetical protein
MRALATLFVALLITGPAAAMSGLVGVYGIVERVVFEPSESAPERVQLWGAFAYVEISGQYNELTTSEARRGYMYFRLPTGARYSGPTQIQNAKTEWKDLKAIAGTGQAVGFGSWGYIGRFDSLAPDVTSGQPPYILESNYGNPLTDLRVRPATEKPSGPAPYQTDSGLVKLSATGTHAAVVAKLREALKR